MTAYAKATVAGLLAFLTALAAALSAGRLGPAEWVTAATCALVTFSGVWAVPNVTPRPPSPAHPAARKRRPPDPPAPAV